MKIYYLNNDFDYELDKLTKIFFPNEKLEAVKEEPEVIENPSIVVKLTDLKENVEIFTKISIGEFTDCSVKTINKDDDAELTAALMLYEHLVKLTGVEPPWGVLTGVRPIKLFRKLKDEMGAEAAEEHFLKVFRVSREKTALTVETEKNESDILCLTSPRSFSLYLSIPFCPSRCSYCSFVSASTERTKHLIEPYTQLLIRELEKTGEIVRDLGLKLESVYTGGGTPTTLSAEQLMRVLDTVRRCFDIGGCREYTVEAGRPDTITEEKLSVMKDVGVDRISINPQTLSDDVLKKIGRRHTAEDVFRSFKLARQFGFDHINTDLIAGLPGDDLEGFKNTLDGIISLSPESITVHTLAMKRASDLTLNGKMIDRDEAIQTSAMLTYSNKKLHENGYIPYYLYRQSRMVGNLDNTGWSLPGKEGYYNVFIMDESQSIIACGAGAVTKIIHDNDKPERIFNYKYPYEYISGFDEILKRKEGIMKLYDKFR